MKTIDFDRIKQALPDRAKVSLNKTDKGTPYIGIVVANPSLYAKGTKEEEEDIEMVMGWLEDIIGKENIMEVFRRSTGTPWTFYLIRQSYEFLNVSVEDMEMFEAVSQSLTDSKQELASILAGSITTISKIKGKHE